MEAQIKDSLNLLLDSIKKADGPAIAEAMGRLDGLVERGQTTLHPQLVHFLKKRSYAKALLFLGGAEDIPVGACGGRSRA